MNELETRAMFAGYHPASGDGAVKPAMQPSSTFVFPTAEAGAAMMAAAYGLPTGLEPNSPPQGHIYSRLTNPTVDVAEARLAAWDEAEDAAFFSTGMAAITTAILAGTGPNRPLWFCSPLYGGTEHFVREILPTMGVTVRELESLDELEAKAAELKEIPGVIYMETPANPTMQLHRMRTAVEFAHRHRTEEHPVWTYVDNTYLGPILQRPLELGVDLLLYSATKYLGGHSDLVAGAASGNKELMGGVKAYRTFLGGMIDSWTAWMLSRSMETLHVRVERQQENCKHVADFLRVHPAIDLLQSAWNEDLPAADQAIAAEQMTGGGAMLAITVRGGREGAFRVLNRLKTFQLAVSLGSSESLAQHPASMTHVAVPDEVKQKFGISEGLIRLSIGLENPKDLIQDLDQALEGSAH